MSRYLTMLVRLGMNFLRIVVLPKNWGNIQCIVPDTHHPEHWHSSPAIMLQNAQNGLRFHHPHHRRGREQTLRSAICLGHNADRLHLHRPAVGDGEHRADVFSRSIPLGNNARWGACPERSEGTPPWDASPRQIPSSPARAVPWRGTGMRM